MATQEEQPRVYRLRGIPNPYYGLNDLGKIVLEYEWFEPDGSVTYLSEEDHRKRERAEAAQE